VAQDFAAGDVFTIVTPDIGTDLADIAITIAGSLS
jgi:hypothetical protein